MIAVSKGVQSDGSWGLEELYKPLSHNYTKFYSQAQQIIYFKVKPDNLNRLIVLMWLTHRKIKKV